VLGLAFLLALNPLRLGLILLMISRPRPVQSLLAFWVGNLTMTIPAVLVPLALLHLTPMSRSLTQYSATSHTARLIQIGLGVLALSIAALMTVRALSRRRQQAHLSAPGSNASTLVLDSNERSAISRLLGSGSDAPTEGQSAIRRLLNRARNAWEDGSVWVAFVIGTILGGPQPGEILYVLAIIVASGAAIGMQVSAAVVFVVGTLAVVEITLAGYAAAPAKTEAVLRRLHDWAAARRGQILIVMLAVCGIALLASGMGGA
jgi:hypothetical protein